MKNRKTKEKTIDLSKCEVGQRVRLRNQQDEKIIKINVGHPYPYACKNGITWDDHGRFQHCKEHPFDIVAILPPAKKAKKPAKKADEKWDISAFSRADKVAARRVIKLLEGLLKP